jgi:hypothetical protein
MEHYLHCQQHSRSVVLRPRDFEHIYLYLYLYTNTAVLLSEKSEFYLHAPEHLNDVWHGLDSFTVKLLCCCVTLFGVCTPQWHFSLLITTWFMQRDGNAVIGRITLRYGIRVYLARVCSSYCVYDGEMLFRTVVLSRACAEPDILTFPSSPLAANANLNYTFFFCC